MEPVAHTAVIPNTDIITFHLCLCIKDLLSPGIAISCIAIPELLFDNRNQFVGCFPLCMFVYIYSIFTGFIYIFFFGFYPLGPPVAVSGRLLKHGAMLLNGVKVQCDEGNYIKRLRLVIHYLYPVCTLVVFILKVTKPERNKLSNVTRGYRQFYGHY